MPGKAGFGHNITTLVSRKVIPAGATVMLDPIGLHNATRVNYFLVADYLQTGAVSGLTGNQYYGMRSPYNAAGPSTLPANPTGGLDPDPGPVNVLIAGNVDIIDMVPMPAGWLNSAVPVQIVSTWNSNREIGPEFDVIELTNTDTVNDVTIDLLADIL
jgi:hypothetical protein